MKHRYGRTRIAAGRPCTFPANEADKRYLRQANPGALGAPSAAAVPWLRWAFAAAFLLGIYVGLAS